MAENGPDHLAVVSISLVDAIRRLIRECVEEPHAHVDDEKEHDDLPAGLSASQFAAVAAAAEPVRY